MTTSCRPHHSSSNSSNASMNPPSDPPPRGSHPGERKIPARASNMGDLETKFRTAHHEGWTKWCVGTAKCDVCDHQGRGVIQRCNVCGWGICRDCSAKNVAQQHDYGSHVWDHDSLDWTPETSKTAKTKSCRPRTTKRTKTVKRKTSRAAADEEEKGHGRLRNTEDATTQTELTYHDLLHLDQPNVAVEDENAAGILARMQTHDTLYRENTPPEAILPVSAQGVQPAPSRYLPPPFPLRTSYPYPPQHSEIPDTPDILESLHYRKPYQALPGHPGTVHAQPVHPPWTASSTSPHGRVPSSEEETWYRNQAGHGRGVFHTGHAHHTEHHASTPSHFPHDHHHSHETRYHISETALGPEPPKPPIFPQTNSSRSGECQNAYSATTHLDLPSSSSPSPAVLTSGKRARSPSTSPGCAPKKQKTEPQPPWSQDHFDAEVNRLVDQYRVISESQPSWTEEECLGHVLTACRRYAPLICPRECISAFVKAAYTSVVQELGLAEDIIEADGFNGRKRK